LPYFSLRSVFLTNLFLPLLAYLAPRVYLHVALRLAVYRNEDLAQMLTFVYSIGPVS
jgi:hypothetical protein